MLFNSLQFIVFFICVVGMYYAIPHRFRWVLLLIASYYFYMCWKVEYVLLIIGSTLIDYFCGLAMVRAKSKEIKQRFLLISLFFNLGVLFAFKYFNFVNESLRLLLDQANIFYTMPGFDVLLPVGISFYTFQTLSYTIDVYRGERHPEKHLGRFALYVAFFPQLVAGPIERSTHLLPQFWKEYKWRIDQCISGLRLMVWGFFKKVVIADRLAMLVDPVYSNHTEYSGLVILLATYAFAFQIYCDFAGYTDIAIGAARILGFDLMKNFRRPYLATSIVDFWKRWHISLTTWFKDYLYIPLGGNRCNHSRWLVNILIVFLISGLWHGANWTFVVWGALHGVFYIVYLMYKKSKGQGCKLPNWLGMFLTFHCVLIGWVFFRAASVLQAIDILKYIFVMPTASFDGVFGVFPIMQIMILSAAIIIVFLKMLGETRQFNSRGMYRQVVFACMLNFILFFGVSTQKSFIYFQF